MSSSKNQTNGISRREFLKGAAVGAAGVAVTGVVAGCGPNVVSQEEADAMKATATPTSVSTNAVSFETAPDPIPDSQIKETVSADVVIVGAGDSGLMAALAAAEAGVNAILLEKSASFNTRGFGNGCIGTKWQKENGIELDKNKIVNDLVRWAGSKVDQRAIKVWADHSGEVYDHVIDLATAAGLPIIPFDTRHGEDPIYPEYPTCLVIGSKFDQSEVLAVIEAEAIAKGADIRYENTAQQLVQDDSGRVVAVIVTNKDGEYVKYEGKNGVILATGDYGNNPEMVEKWCPWAKNVDTNVYFPAVNTGDGHKMGLWVGGAMQDAPHAPMIHTLGGASFNCNPGLRVNSLGERYENEDVPNPYVCNGRMRQPGNVAWAVFDANINTAAAAMTPGFGRTGASDTAMDTLAGEVEKGVVLMADTIEDLAAAMKVPAQNLAATVNRYNDLAAAGEDEDFGKSANNLSPIDTAPFYATKVPAALLVTLGGFMVDDNMRVLNNQGLPIPGLYAAGNVAGGFYANDYPVIVAGLSHGRCITEGYLAGKHAASV